MHTGEIVFILLLVTVLVGIVNVLLRYLPAINVPSSKVYADVKEPIYKLVKYDSDYSSGLYIAKYELGFWRDKRWFIHFIPFSQLFKIYGYGEIGRQYCTKNVHNIPNLESAYNELWSTDEYRLKQVKMDELNSEFNENNNKLKQA